MAKKIIAEYSGKDIMDKLEEIQRHNEEQHDTIQSDLSRVYSQAKTTNGKVKLHDKILIGIITAGTTLFGIVITVVIKLVG